LPKIKAFDENIEKYEQWFIDNKLTYKSELRAVFKVIPKNKEGFEVGIGSGLFAKPVGINEGIDPSYQMCQKAKKRGINVIRAVAESLPYQDECKDFALIVTTICFVDNILKTFSEIHRVLNRGGNFIIGFVEKNSPVGKLYLKKKKESIFYKDANFYGVDEIYNLLTESGFFIEETYQTVFGELNKINNVQNMMMGSGNGSLLLLKHQKK